MNIILILSVIALALVILFVFGHRKTRAKHAVFDKKDIISALENLISKDAQDHDEFDLFRAWPIDNPYLESIRQRASEIYIQYHETNSGRDINQEGAEQIQKLIEEVKNNYED